MPRKLALEDGPEGEPKPKRAKAKAKTDPKKKATAKVKPNAKAYQLKQELHTSEPLCRPSLRHSTPLGLVTTSIG